MMKSLTARPVIAVLLAALLLCPLGSQGSASATTNDGFTLGGSQPQSDLLLQMCARGAHDYGLIHRTFPASLDEAMQAGYMAYQLPAATNFLYTRAEDKITVFSHEPTYVFGTMLGTRIVARRFPPSILSREETRYSMDPPMQVRVWMFQGAQYLHAGHSMAELDVFLRRQRLGTHLAHLTMEYSTRYQPDQLPANLAELEAFQGLSRNPAAWRDVQPVASLEEVALQPGNLYVGPDSRGKLNFGGRHSSWVVAINIGPEVQEWPFVHFPESDGSSLASLRWNMGVIVMYY
jgi:hypothetical protein